MAAKHVNLQGNRAVLDREVMNLQKELLMLQSLSHPNIVKYLHVEVSSDASGLDILLEYVPGGSVRSLLNKFGKLEERVVRRYTQHLLAGLSYLHAQGIVHRDIKCAHLLVDRDGCVKLSDFGESKRLTANYDETAKPACSHALASFGGDYGDVARTTSLRGSPYWMSPEVVLRTGHSFSADIWSVGCALIEMLTAVPPWANLTKNSREVLQLIASGSPRVPTTVSEECQEFISLCLKTDASQRPTAKQLLEHRFITGSFEPETTRTRASSQVGKAGLAEESNAEQAN
jgi:serine/threonine protein kinase